MKGASSLSGKCHTFDIKADGYIKAEAVNAVILKRLDDALRDRDPIRAIIRGTATNSDGRTPGIASPSSEAQAAAIRAAYANASITDLSKTTYIECHGTGTQAGDPLEVQGVSSVFASTRPFDQPLIIGSVSPDLPLVYHQLLLQASFYSTGSVACGKQFSRVVWMYSVSLRADNIPPERLYREWS